MGFSLNAIAQKSTAFLLLKSSKQVVDERTAIVTFQLNNVSDEKTKQKFQDSFKTYQGVREVNATLQSGNMASFSLTMPKKGTSQALQNIFKTAGIETVNIDGKNVETYNLVNYINEQKEKK